MTSQKKYAARPAESRIDRETSREFPLGRNNFILMEIAAAIIVIGFLLMLGGSSTEQAFNPDIFSTRRIVVGPTIAFLGFIFMGFAIIRKPKDNVAAEKTTDGDSAKSK